MDKTIHVYIKQNYGNEYIYPNCHESRLLAELAGTTTLTLAAIGTIKKMGYNIVVDMPRRYTELVNHV